MPKLRRETTTHPAVLRELTVVATEDVTPRMRRLVLGGDALGAHTIFSPDQHSFDVPTFVSPGFDDHVKVFVPPEGADRPVLPRPRADGLDWTTEGTRPIGKDYTPRRVTGDTIVLDFVRHGHGLASSWAERAQIGDPAWIVGPTIGLAMPHAVDWFAVAGDETALPAIGRLLEELPAGARAEVVVEVADAAEEQQLASAADVSLHWVHRDGAEPGTTTLLADAVRELPWHDGQVYAWMSGESTAARAVRTHWRGERAVPRDCLDVTGYWRR